MNSVQDKPSKVAMAADFIRSYFSVSICPVCPHFSHPACLLFDVFTLQCVHMSYIQHVYSQLCSPFNMSVLKCVHIQGFHISSCPHFFNVSILVNVSIFWCVQYTYTLVCPYFMAYILLCILQYVLGFVCSHFSMSTLHYLQTQCIYFNIPYNHLW